MGFPTDVIDLAAWQDERLHPDLQPFLQLVEMDGSPMKLLQHPLVVSLFPIPGACNREYEHKRKLMAEVTTIRQRLALTERPFRLETLVKWAYMTNRDNAAAVDDLRVSIAFAWPDMESDDTVTDPTIVEVVKLFRRLGYITDNAPLPETALRVYRGGAPNGIAWSTDVKTAQWFAKRFKREGEAPEPVFTALAPPEAIMARFSGRGESEVTCEPDKLQHVQRLR